MSETPVVVASTEQSAAEVQATPAPKLNAIQLIEQELSGFIKQREQAVANVHAVEGAIQAAQHLLMKLRIAAATAEAEAKKLLGEAASEAGKVVEFVKKEL